MRLLEALEVLKEPVCQPVSNRELHLVCGFTPLHLKTFLEAHLRTLWPASLVETKVGLYGDLDGNLSRLQPSSGATACVVLEWADLDARLGIRSLGRWRIGDIDDIVESAQRQGKRLAYLIAQLKERVPTYVVMPTLPLPPIFSTREGQAHHKACELREVVASLATSISTDNRVRLLDAQLVDEISPLAQRFDPEAEIASGFPYSLEHASKLAELLANLLCDVPPKKGLITDLDDTLWSGVLGEIGVEGIAWDISRGAHLHGLYQRFLDSLSSSGVLLAIASKNDWALAENALSRNDILLPQDRVFPLEINWGAKSMSVYRILKQWNIMPGDVVFVDDSPAEVAEVKASFPEMECVVFPKNSCSAVWQLIKHLRDRFGKTTVSVEDEVRLSSIRRTADLRDSLQAPGNTTTNFLRGSEATVRFSLRPDARDSRAFELINKTNQFNLNGRRISESEWLAFIGDPAAFILTASYEDKYSPLGKVAVLAGKRSGSGLYVYSWVMSCRAFSRHIEHQCLKYLFDNLETDQITFDFRITPRNAPIQNFFRELLGEPPVSTLSINKAMFCTRTPALFHRVVDVTNA